MTYRYRPDFRCLIPKGGGDYIGITLDRYQGADIVAVRVWREIGSDCFQSLSHGVNLLPQIFGGVLLEVALELEEPDGEPSEIDLGNGTVLVIQRQVFRGTKLLAVRVHRRHRGKLLPTKNGLTIRPELWAALLDPLYSAIDELVSMDEILKNIADAVCLRVIPKLQHVL